MSTLIQGDAVRVTAKAKLETRDRILRCARKLFLRKGFEGTTTRDIAEAASIATGTLFNYFPTKEALAIEFLSDALGEADEAFCAKTHDGESLDELLFAYVAEGLRKLRPCRPYVREMLETALSPFAQDGVSDSGSGIRLRHLETVRGLIMSHSPGGVDEPSVVTMHLYWTLYLGVLSFWAKDDTPNQEETLALLDQSLRLFTESLSADRSLREGPTHGT